MELGMTNKLHHLEETLNWLSNMLITNQRNPNHDNHHREGNNHHKEGNNGGQQIISSKTIKLDFPWFLRDDPTKWFDRVEQFFEYLGTTENQKVPWLLTTLKRRSTSGGSGFKGRYRKKGKWFHGKDFKKNYGLASDHEVVKILMKLSKKIR